MPSDAGGCSVSAGGFMGVPNGAAVPPGGQQPPAGDPEKPTAVTEAIRSIVGLLVAGFAGALNFIGLKNGEVPVVLRNEARAPTLILCLIVAAILTAVASIFVRPEWKVSVLTWMGTACALETVSQLSNTSVQLSATISETGRTASMVLSIDAAKMQNGDRVNVLVAGLRRYKHLAKFCKNTPIKANLPCSWAPCFTRSSFMGYLHLPRGCDAISSGIYQPSAAGTVQQTVTIPVSDVRYRGLELIGSECVISNPDKPCTYSTYDPNITRVDIQIPKDTAS